MNSNALKGMMTMRTKICIASLAMALFGSAGTAFAQAAAGEVTLLTGRATASNDDGVVRVLNKGDTVYSGELISSGVNSYVNLKFKDGGLILLRPRTRFEIEAFAYDSAPAIAEAEAPKPLVQPAAPKPATASAAAATPAVQTASTRAFFRLLKGSFRAVSGAIGKANQDDYRVATPVATIGIRGTDFFAEIIDASFARDPVLRQNLPAGTSAEGGVYVQQFDGVTEVTSNSGLKTFVNKGQSLVTLASGSQVKVPEANKIKLNPPADPAAASCSGS